MIVANTDWIPIPEQRGVSAQWLRCYCHISTSGKYGIRMSFGFGTAQDKAGPSSESPEGIMYRHNITRTRQLIKTKLRPYLGEEFDYEAAINAMKLEELTRSGR